MDQSAISDYQFIYRRVKGKVVDNSNAKSKFYTLISGDIVRKVNKLKHKVWEKRHNNRVRYEVLYHYSNGIMECRCCHENCYDFLTIDHVNNDGAEHRRKINGSLYRWLIKNNFPEGYQVLCYNCNCAKGNYGKCPHEYMRSDI